MGPTRKNPNRDCGCWQAEYLHRRICINGGGLWNTLKRLMKELEILEDLVNAAEDYLVESETERPTDKWLRLSAITADAREVVNGNS